MVVQEVNIVIEFVLEIFSPFEIERPTGDVGVATGSARVFETRKPRRPTARDAPVLIGRVVVETSAERFLRSEKRVFWSG